MQEKVAKRRGVAAGGLGATSYAGGLGATSYAGGLVLGPLWALVVLGAFAAGAIALGRRRDGAGVVGVRPYPRAWLGTAAAILGASTVPVVGLPGLLALPLGAYGAHALYQRSEYHYHRKRLQLAHERIASVIGAPFDDPWDRWLSEDGPWVKVRYDPATFKAYGPAARRAVEGALQFALEADEVEARWPAQASAAWIRPLPPLPTHAALDGEVLDNLALAPSVLALGEGREEVVTVDLDRAPHILIAGATGRGKTTTIRGIVAQLTRKPDTDLVLCDLKRTDYVGLDLGENVTRVSAASPRPDLPEDPDELAAVAAEAGDPLLPLRADPLIGPIVGAILDAAAEVERRYADAEDAGGWDKVRFRRLVVVIDEATTLTVRARAAMRRGLFDAYGNRLRGDHPVLSAMSDIARRGRECRVSIVCAQHRPAVELLPAEDGGEFRDQCECRITTGQVASDEAARMMAASDHAQQALRAIDSAIPGRGAVQVLGHYFDAQLYEPDPALYTAPARRSRAPVGVGEVAPAEAA